MDGVGAGVGVPIGAFADRVPSCFGAFIGDACQASATVERMIAYTPDAVRDRDAC